MDVLSFFSSVSVLELVTRGNLNSTRKGKISMKTSVLKRDYDWFVDTSKVNLFQFIPETVQQKNI